MSYKSNTMGSTFYGSNPWDISAWDVNDLFGLGDETGNGGGPSNYTWQSELNPTNWNNPGTGPGHVGFTPVGASGYSDEDVTATTTPPKKPEENELTKWFKENSTAAMIAGLALVLILVKK